ncbi:MAG: double-strand break repair helicase AddA [Parvibaculaceae bacterium]|nr:double-strand break repair helicase AddA [Parvibaculaceae bacterium]
MNLLDETPLDYTTRAQAAASRPDASAWVSANAGSGKTYVLIQRISRLLLAGTQPNRILCLTYTKAAAAEMSARLYKQLGDWAVMDEEPLRAALTSLEGHPPTSQQVRAARLLFARAIETPGGLKIQTIHAFCEQILGRFPLEAGVSTHFQILDERSAAELLAEARSELLAEFGAHAQEGAPLTPAEQALDYIIAQSGEFGLGALMDAILTRRSRYQYVLNETSAEDALNGLREKLGVHPGETEEHMYAQAHAATPQKDLENAITLLSGSGANDQKQAERLRAYINPQDLKAAFDMYASAFVTTTGEDRKSLVTKKLTTAHPHLLDVLEDERERLRGVANRLRAMKLYTAAAHALHIAEALILRFSELKARHAFLDYDDLIEKTRKLIENPAMSAWVRFKLDGGIDHILVDEAQDTSPDQWVIIKSLAEEFFAGDGAHEGIRTVFAVGDEKQSIYSFQGADPAQFDAAKQHFAARVEAAKLAWHPVELLLSFRSATHVLKTVDDTFASPDARRGLSAQGIAPKHLAKRDDMPGLVEVWETEKPEDAADDNPWDVPLDFTGPSHPTARLAARIADRIKEWMDTGEPIYENGPAITPGDVMILVRRRNALVEDLIRALKKRAIPVAGADRMVLTEQIAVMDLLALARFALLPEDDLTLATVLKSPLLRWSEEQLFDLAYQRGHHTLWHSILQQERNAPHIAQAFAFLSHVRAKADRVRPYEFFADILIAEQGREKLLAQLGPDAADPMDELLQLALEFERAHPASLQGFLHWLDSAEVQIKREHDQGRNEVRVMTVHGSKGLEAPIVFLPDTCTLPTASGLQAKLYDLDAPELPPLWVGAKKHDDANASAARQRIADRGEEEYRRLLYVAMTRAEDRLYITGYENSRGMPDGCWYDLAATAICPQADKIEEGGHTLWRLGKVPTKAVNGAASLAPTSPLTQTPTSLPLWINASPASEPTPSRPLAPSQLPLDGVEEPVALSPLQASNPDRYKRGRLIHRLLQLLPDLPSETRAAATEQFLAQTLHGLSEAERAEMAAATLPILEDERFAALFGPGSRAEVPLTGEIMRESGTVVMAGQVDRLLETPTEIAIIDFKTNRPAAKSTQDIAPAYVAQMAAYRALLQRAYPEKQVTCWLLWTDGPDLMEIPSGLMEKVFK